MEIALRLKSTSSPKALQFIPPSTKKMKLLELLSVVAFQVEVQEAAHPTNLDEPWWLYLLVNIYLSY